MWDCERHTSTIHHSHIGRDQLTCGHGCRFVFCNIACCLPQWRCWRGSQQNGYKCSMLHYMATVSSSLKRFWMLLRTACSPGKFQLPLAPPTALCTSLVWDWCTPPCSSNHSWSTTLHRGGQRKTRGWSKNKLHWITLKQAFMYWNPIESAGLPACLVDLECSKL